MSGVLPVSGPDLQNYIHQTYASANLLLAMLWFVLFVSCCGLESPIHFKRLCDWRRLDWHSTQNASRSVCPWVLYSATSATRVVIFFINVSKMIVKLYPQYIPCQNTMCQHRPNNITQYFDLHWTGLTGLKMGRGILSEHSSCDTLPVHGRN